MPSRCDRDQTRDGSGHLSHFSLTSVVFSSFWSFNVGVMCVGSLSSWKLCVKTMLREAWCFWMKSCLCLLNWGKRLWEMLCTQFYTLSHIKVVRRCQIWLNIFDSSSLKSSNLRIHECYSYCFFNHDNFCKFVTSVQCVSPTLSHRQLCEQMCPQISASERPRLINGYLWNCCFLCSALKKV